MSLGGAPSGWPGSSGARATRFGATFGRAPGALSTACAADGVRGVDDWLRERFFRHGGNADVVRQELAAEHGIVVGLRYVERRVVGWRRELKAQARATVRFETPPGKQLQIDFGETRVLDRGRTDSRAPVRRHLGLFQTPPCSSVAAGAPSRLV